MVFRRLSSLTMGLSMHQMRMPHLPRTINFTISRAAHTLPIVMGKLKEQWAPSRTFSRRVMTPTLHYSHTEQQLHPYRGKQSSRANPWSKQGQWQMVTHQSIEVPGLPIHRIVLIPAGHELEQFEQCCVRTLHSEKGRCSVMFICML